ncbi:dipeptidase, partial [Acidisphaera rubrifaciens]|uniref:dipeptidase n=1 Tax=Acidisphaera rubrifaciens TaxID=50715 RepID=UPI000662AD81
DLAAYAPRAFARLHALARAQDMALIADAAALLAARADRPAAIAASEGGDFLEGALDRLDDAYARWTLRHLQLTHYRVNELGDVQTSAPVHGGLSAFGAAVIRRCNALGIGVDVAHGTYDLVRQAASVSRAPLVLSHSSITAHPGPRQRRITPEHARVVAATGGVIGIWPPRAVFPTMAALAEGIARAVDVVGIAHVGIGTDMGGLIAGTCFPDYTATPALVAALRRQGFGGPEIAAIMGGNYARVFARAVG